MAKPDSNQYSRLCYVDDAEYVEGTEHEVGAEHAVYVDLSETVGR